MLEATYHVVSTDSRGRYFVAGGLPHFWVFDQRGAFLKRVGRRGNGPGEFQLATQVVPDPSDSLFVFDPVQARLSVYSPDLVFARSSPVEGVPDGKGWFFADFETLVANYPIPSPERVGYPLHLLSREGRIERSFGSLTKGLFRPDMQEIINIRPMAGAPDGTVSASWVNQIRLEQWSLAGELIRSLHRDAEWFEPWWRPTLSLETPPQPVVEALMHHEGQLWLLLTIAGERWREAVEPSGRFFKITDPDAYQQSRVEVIDPRTEQVIASTTLDQRVDAFLGNGLVVRTTEDHAGNPIVRIGRISIAR